jgi:iron complex outermembrane receptor protein
MKRGTSLLLATSSLFVYSTVAAAQAVDQPSADAATQAQEANEAIERNAIVSPDIVVTARRRAESLQDVPQTVNAVTGEEIDKLNIQDFEDIETVVPGLNLESAGNGFGATASMRGASFDVVTGSKPTVVFYMNEVPIESNILFSSMFDIGQVEVLRGPQGTLRGRSAPSGAITVTTRRPDLNEPGGALNMTLTDHDGMNVQGGLSVPIIPDVLAVRLAGIIDESDNGGVRSVNNGRKPLLDTKAGRVTARFEPTDTISATVMYQYMKRRSRRYTQVTGTGAPGGTVPAYVFAGFTYPARPAPPANYNGPPIDPEDRLAVGEDPTDLTQEFQILTGTVDWEFAGQKLSYIGGWSKQNTSSRGGGDPLNSYLGAAVGTLDNINSYTSHEVRLASIERIANVFDYTLGAFWLTEKNDVNTIQRRFFPGAFGPIPANTTVPQPLVLPNEDFIAFTGIRRLGTTKEMSFFGTLTAHVDERSEITGGVRHITWKERPTGPFFIDNATTPPATLYDQGSTICLTPTHALLPIGVTIPIPATCIANAADPNNTKDTAWVWNVSASHRFSDDLMVYATVGTSWRAGPFSVAPFDLEAPGFASSNDLRFHVPEKSRSYEIGFKSSFLDRRGRLNVAAYYQTFKNYFYLSNGTPYLTFQAGAPRSTSSFDFTGSADAKVYGVDVEAAFKITPNWDISAAFSWAKGQIADDEVPCNDSDFDGVADNGVPTVAGFVAAGVIVARCKSNASISRSPRWNLSVRSEYAQPVRDDMDAFLRGQLTYYPSNPYKTRDLVIDSYGLLNLYAGLRAPDNAWEINVFAKNVLNTTKIVDFTLNTVPHEVYGDPGYSTVDLTARREFGINVRIAFGSR